MATKKRIPVAPLMKATYAESGRFLPGSNWLQLAAVVYANNSVGANAKSDYTRLRLERSAGFIVDYPATATFATYQYNA